VGCYLKRWRFDERVMLVDLRLAPGEEVELTVRPSNAERNTASSTNSLWQLSECLQIDAPADYSVNFEQAPG
jgi:hypothetical protein